MTRVDITDINTGLNLSHSVQTLSCLAASLDNDSVPIRTLRKITYN